MDIIAFGLTDDSYRRRYDDLFERCPNAVIQQSTYWAEVIKDSQPHTPIFLLLTEDGRDIAGLPLYLLERSPGNAMTSVPESGPLGGVFCREDASREQRHRIYRALIERAERIAAECRCMALSIISSPFAADVGEYLDCLEPTYVLENFTQFTALDTAVSPTGEILLPDYRRRSNLSRNLRRASQSGLTVTECVSFRDLEALYAVHAKRHQELGAPPLPIEQIVRIDEILVPRGKALLTLVQKGADIASGCVYIRHQNVFDVLRLTLDSRFLEFSPNYINTEFSLRWARKRGARVYNWGSSLKRNDGIYRYKKQWGAAEAQYAFVTKLYCDPKRVIDIGLDRLKTDYAFHFVVPYLAFTEGFDKRVFRK